MDDGTACIVPHVVVVSEWMLAVVECVRKQKIGNAAKQGRLTALARTAIVQGDTPVRMRVEAAACWMA